MGGCATKPKDANIESLPRENPTSPNPKQEKRALDGDPTVASEEVNTGNDKSVETTSKEEPLVDLSDPKPDETKHGGEVKTDETAISELMSEIGGGSKPEHEESSNPVKSTTPDDSMKTAAVDHDADEKKTPDGSKPDHEDSSNPVKSTTPDDSMKTAAVDHDADEKKTPDGSKPDHEDSSNPVKSTTPDDPMKTAAVDHEADEKKTTADPAKAFEVSKKEEKEEEDKQKPDVEAEKEQLQAQKENNVEEGEVLASPKSEPVEKKDIKPEVSEHTKGENSHLAA